MLGKIEGRRRWESKRGLDGIINSMDMNLNKLQEIVEDRGAWGAAVNGVTKSQTWLSNWTKMSFRQVHYLKMKTVQFSRSVMSNSATPWTAEHQASLSITNSRSLLELISIESVMPSNHLILCHPLLLLPSIFPASQSFQMSQFFASGGQSIGVSASVLPMNIQDWFPSGWTSWIALLSKGPSRVFSNTTVQKHQFFSVQLSL